MSFKISNDSLPQYLTVDSAGLEFCKGQLLVPRRFRFHQIDSLLLSQDHTLSFQVENEVFSIPTQPDNADHRNVIDFLIQEVRRTTD